MTIKPYNELITLSMPAIRKIHQLRFLRSPCEQVEEILSKESLDVINTLCVIMIIGRQHSYNGRKKPFKQPDKVFKSWAADLWEFGEDKRKGLIDYVSGKNDVLKHLNHGEKLLGISLNGGVYIG